MFAEKAQKLIRSDCVAAVFGGWTSSSRKAMLPVFEGNNALLFYPVQYEGLESSQNIFYTGATTNQQIVPGAGLPQGAGREEPLPGRQRLRLPADRQQDHQGLRRRRTAWRSWARSTPRWATPTSPPSSRSQERRRRRGVQHAQRRLQRRVLQGVQERGPDRRRHAGAHRVDRRGGGRRHRHRQHRRPAGGLELLPDHRQPGEQEVRRRTSRPCTARTRSPPTRWRPPTPRSTSGRAWSRRPNSFAVADVQAAAGGVTLDAPEGTVTVNGDNQHIAKTARIGKIAPDGLIDTDWRRASRSSPTRTSRATPGPAASVADRPAPVRAAGRAPCTRTAGSAHSSPRRPSHRKDSHGSPGHPAVQRAERGVDPAAGRARPGAHVRPDGRHQHGARRVHHGRRLHRLSSSRPDPRRRRRSRCSCRSRSPSSSPACSACCSR